MSVTLKASTAGVMAVKSLERILRRLEGGAPFSRAELKILRLDIRAFRAALQPHHREAATNFTEMADAASRRQQHIPEFADALACALGSDLLYVCSLTSPDVPY